MKNILPVLLLSACSIAANAVPLHSKTNTKHAAHLAAMQHVLQQQLPAHTSAKTTAAPKRLIANSYVRNGTLLDSNHFYYSGYKGSTHTVGDSYFDNYYPLAPIATPVQNILCDSSANWRSSGSAMMRTNTKKYKYDATNRVTNSDLANTYRWSQFISAYNTAGEVNDVTSLDTFGGTPMTPSSKMYMSYNSAGRRIKDSMVVIGTSDVMMKRIYIYSPAGNLDTFLTYNGVAGMPLDLFSRITYTYDGSNRVVTTTSEYGSGFPPVLENSYKDSVSYTGTIPQPTFRQSFSWDATLSNWVPDERIYTHYNTANNVDTMVYLSFNSSNWDTTERNVYNYYPDGLLSHSHGYTYLGNGQFANTPYDKSTFYFEEYFPVSIAGNTSNITASLYPNPASGTITLHTSLNAAYDITITNMQGQIVYTEHHINTPQKNIPISHLGTGNYILNIFATGGEKLATQQFSKQ